MNTRLTKLFISAATALTIIACSDSGVNYSGIGGSGYISSGSITGFGSVFVNGVEFFGTESAIITVDGEPATEADLAIGMVVQVSGSINDDGVTGTATAIDFDDDLQGPVANLTAPDVDGITRSFTVFGTTVIVDSGSTSFDVSSNLPAGTVFDFDTISDDNNVEVSGFFNQAGELVATRVELKQVSFDASSIVEVKGTISNLVGTTFNLGTNLSVDASAATLEDLPNGLIDGQLVEVQGTFDSTTNTITASVVEAEDDSFADSSKFELEGIITNYVNNNNFMVAGIPVDASNAIFEPSTLALQLENDLRIEVEGAIVNGILIAKEVELEGGDIKVHAYVTAINNANNTFEVSPVAGQTITVTVSTDTQMEDDVNKIEPFTLANLNTDDFVNVRGYDDGFGGITATEVEVKEADSVIVQGIMQSDAAGTINVFGIEFVIDNPGETSFEGVNDQSISQSAFNDATTPDQSLIKVKDDDYNGVADEIDIESP